MRLASLGAEQTRSFQYVDDLVNGLIKLMNGDYSQPVNLGNPDEYTVADFAKKIKDLTEVSERALMRTRIQATAKLTLFHTITISITFVLLARLPPAPCSSLGAEREQNSLFACHSGRPEPAEARHCGGKEGNRMEPSRYSGKRLGQDDRVLPAGARRGRRNRANRTSGGQAQNRWSAMMILYTIRRHFNICLNLSRHGVQPRGDYAPDPAKHERTVDNEHFVQGLGVNVAYLNNDILHDSSHSG